MVAVLLVSCSAESESESESEEPPFEVGIASWYGEAFAGQPTASGAPYDPDAATAAHRTLPFGTVVEVARTDGGEAAVVEINDRGPYVDGRIIDVSRAAAAELDMLGDGTAPVELRIVR